MYKNNILLRIDPPIMVCSYHTEQQSEVVKSIEVPAEPIEMVMDYMTKRINQIDKTRKEFRDKYPNLLPATL